MRRAAAASLVLLAACSSSGGGRPAAYGVTQLEHRLVTAGEVGATEPARITAGTTRAHSATVAESIETPTVLVIVTLTSAPDGRSAAQAFAAFARASDAFFARGATRTGLDLGDAGFTLDGKRLGSSFPQLELAFVRGPVEATVTMTTTAATPAPFAAADRSLAMRVAAAQDAKLR